MTTVSYQTRETPRERAERVLRELQPEERAAFAEATQAILAGQAFLREHVAADIMGALDRARQSEDDGDERGPAVRPLVAHFARMMEAKLRLRDQVRPAFDTVPPRTAFGAIGEELDELGRALGAFKTGPLVVGDLAAIAWECVDVATSALILGRAAGVIVPPEPVDGRGRALPVGEDERAIKTA